MNHSVVEVVFKVHAEVGFGEEIYLCGNVPALGCDTVERAIPLVTSTDDYPWWQTKEGIFLPGDAGAVKYRYCVFSGGKFSRWEGGPSFVRNLDVSHCKSLVKETEDFLGDGEHKFGRAELSPRKVATTAASEAHIHAAKMLQAWSRSVGPNNDLSSQDGVIIVSYFLPVILSRRGNTGKWSAQWDKEALLSLQIDVRLIWVGSVRYGNAPIPQEEEENVAAVLADMNCFPVFLSQSAHHKFFDIFCKQSLWLVMHHIADVYGPQNRFDKSVKAQESLWFNYSTVHNAFREKVLEVFQQGYLIWIHGFHLMLLPSFLRRRIPQAKIGYFFHTPFPSSEIWRTMSHREDLLRGILGADQIGFHLFEYARHFVTTCHRLLGCNSETNASGMMTINVDGREVALSCIHVGVDLPRLTEIFCTEHFVAEVQQWKAKFPGRVIISGIDRLERLKGIPLRLMALDEFLEENPQWLGKLVFPFIGISAGERGEDYRQTQHDVRILVDRLNEKYAHCGTNMFYFEERSDRDCRLAQRLAFFAASDILLMTAIRDGLNRYPMEFTLARQMHGSLVDSRTIFHHRAEGAGLPGQGLVIISEFVSSARVMRGALIVNPWRVCEVKEVLTHALKMDDNERADRSRKNLEFSTRLTTANWAKHVLNDLKAVEGSADPSASYGVGFGLQYKVMNLKAGFSPLNVKETCKAFRGARHRLILLDWSGTLVPNVDKHDKLHAYALAKGHAVANEGPSQELREVLERLCEDRNNAVFVISGKEVRALTEAFHGFRNLGLAAEHGFYYKLPQSLESRTSSVAASNNSLTPSVSATGLTANSSTVSITSVKTTQTQPHSQSQQWQTIMDIGDQTWKESARVVMDIFVQRTHGTYIEQKGNALIWQYSDADPEFGFMQSKELEEHLNAILAAYPVEVIRGGGVADGYIEVRPTGADKGSFLEHALSVMKAANMEADFILAVGDDASDEPMFERIGLHLQEHPELAAFSVTVGRKPTLAKAYLDDSSSVVEMLQMLSKSSLRVKKYHSAIDLSSQLNAEAGHRLDLSGLSRLGPALPMQHSIPSSGLVSRPLHRASSDGNIARPQADSVHLRPAWSAAADLSPSVPAIQRTVSSAHLSMTEYMHSIQEAQDDDDAGIFF